MKICRFNDNRLGLVDVEANEVRDVTAALKVLPKVSYPLPHGDLMMANFAKVKREITRLAPRAPKKKLSSVKLLAPIANPGKIIGAPINYAKHIDEARKDAEIHAGGLKRLMSTPIGKWGLFLKANSALVGPSEGVVRRFPRRRTDHEVELAVIIGRKGTNIKYKDALNYVAGYAIGLDMVIRGSEVQSFRKSVDTYAVLGPWMVTKDEIKDPDDLDLEIRVGKTLRQSSNTSNLIFDVRRLIEFGSSFYTLYPGDVIMTGTPEGVNRVKPGDVMHATIEKIGSMDVKVRGQS